MQTLNDGFIALLSLLFFIPIHHYQYFYCSFILYIHCK